MKIRNAGRCRVRPRHTDAESAHALLWLQVDPESEYPARAPIPVHSPVSVPMVMAPTTIAKATMIGAAGSATLLRTSWRHRIGCVGPTKRTGS